jgi:hypothetical protein
MAGAPPYSGAYLIFAEKRIVRGDQMIRRIGLRVYVCLFFLIAAAPARAGDVAEALKTFASAKVVIGQKNFTSGECDQGANNPTANSLCGPEGAAAAGKKVFYVPDSENNRVLGFKKIPKKNGASAKFVLGQTNFTNSNEGTSSAGFNFPGKVTTAGNQLFMVDFSNSRVLIWNKLPTKTNTPANVVVGQPDFTSSASALTQSGLDHPENGLSVASGKLLIADRNNNRVMIWNSIPTTNGANADVVVGQPDFTSNGVATTQTGLGFGPVGGPEGVWTDGTRLVVADSGNNRILIWNSIPTTNGAPADVVVGQPDFTSLNNPNPPTAQSLNEPGDVASDGTRLFVEDSNNNRILVYNTFPTSNNPAADIVLGQPDLTHNNAGDAGPTAQTLNFPFGMSLIGNQLVVTDFGNDRYLIFSTK